MKNIKKTILILLISVTLLSAQFWNHVLPDYSIVEIIPYDGGYWFATESSGALRFDIHENEWHFYNQANGIMPQNDDINDMKIMDNKVWFATNYGIYTCSMDGSNWDHDILPGDYFTNWIRAFDANTDTVFIASFTGLFTYSLKTRTYTSYDNLMPGYYKDEEKTKEAIDKDGWFHTGDTGVLDGKILKITGRTKEIFKLSTGKYVAPELVENKMKESPFIEQLMVVGDGEKYAAAIVCPAFEHLHNWASRHNISYKDNLDLITNETVIERYATEIEKKNYKLDPAMKIKKFSLVCEEWTPETGELSPTLKLKRRILVQNYKVKLDYLYGYTEDEGFLLKE